MEPGVISGDGGPATSAQLNYPTGVAVDTAGNLFIADSYNSRVRMVTGVASVTTFFPQVAAGGGYSTLFTITNTGATTASGTVTMTDQQGNPFTVSGILIDSLGTTQPAVSGSSFAFSVPSGGTVFLTASAVTTSSPLKVGWVQIDSTGGTLAAVATYEYAIGSATQSMVGVLQSQALQYMTIPVDNDSSQNQQTAYAIANPSGQTIAIQLALVGQDGIVVDNSVTITLTPKQQIARYLWQDLAARTNFKGSLVLRGQNGATFAAVALVDKQGIFTVIPLSFAQSGIITTYAGGGNSGLGDGGPATAAQVIFPTHVAVDSAGNLFIVSNNRVRKVTAAGIISTVAGNGTQGFSGDGGPATAAEFYIPSGVAVDSAGNLFIGDYYNNRIRKVTAAGIISTVAGNGTQGFSGDGGPATSAQLNLPGNVTVDSAGTLYIVDFGNNRIRKVTAAGVISTVVGNGTHGFSGDGGPATSAQLNSPFSVVADAAGNLFIGDRDNTRIRKVTAAGIISTVAGNGTQGFSGDGGPATAAQLNLPMGVAVDSMGNLFIADAYNNRIRKVTAAGIISTVAGNGTQGFSGDDGPATAAQLWYPLSVAVDSAGNLFVADANNQRIREVTGVASVTTFFPQVAVGDGSSTLFIVTNTGSTAASGYLVLTDQQGNPFTVSGVLTDSSGTTQPASVGSSFSIDAPAGGTDFLSATSVSPNNPTSSGWAELESTGGSLTGVATYEYVSGGILQYMVGVLQSQLHQFATIPVDNDNTQDKQMAYAIANPSSETISIKLALVGQDGTVVDDTVTVTLSPGQQIAKYLSQDLPARANFKGSLVLRGQAGARFIAVTLLQKQGLFTVIPLISGKAPGIPD